MAAQSPEAQNGVSPQASPAIQTRPLRVLSLDGGGVRGLSSLLILRRIMHNVKPADSVYDIAKPCDYFDMICGTSTGGLIAIMLGRLRMGVQEAIDAYLDLAKNVFQETDRLSRWKAARTIKALIGNARFSGTALADAIQSIVIKNGEDKDAPLLDTREDSCKVFVCATQTTNSEPALLRSYRSTREESLPATIWEAGRATAAAPTFFPPITFGNPPAEYVDGAIGHNNPIRLLMREVGNVWGPNATLGCVISIGTGFSDLRKLGPKAHKVLLACAKLATSAETIAREFQKDHGEKLQEDGKYFRFNVAQGLQGIGLEEWKRFGDMDAATRLYLDEIGGSIWQCCNRLRDPDANLPSPLGITSIESPITSPIVRFESQDSTTSIGLRIYDVQHNSSPYFTGRESAMKAIEEHFLERYPDKPRTAVLCGLGGIGKTQISLRYFETHKTSYSSAFFVQCNSQEEATAAYLRFAGLVVDEELRTTPTSDYDEVAKRLGFSGLLTERPGRLMEEAHRRVIKAVGVWLGRKQGKSLVILDNADDPTQIDLASFIPQCGNVDVIITTRDEGVQVFGKLLHIDEMSPKEAVALLSQASHLKLDTPELLGVAKQITETLGYLPLAIDLACGYLVAPGSDIRQFLSTYELRYKSLLSQMPSEGMLGYKKSALTTWEMSFDRLKTDSALILQFLGFVHCKDICEPLYYHLADKTAERARDPQGNSFSFDETLRLLCKLSLVRRNDKAGACTYEIHKVVHLWIKERLDPRDQEVFSRGAIVRVARAVAVLNKISRQDRKTLRRLYPHVEAAWENLEKYTSPEYDGAHEGFMETLRVISIFFQNQGYYELAERGIMRIFNAKTASHGANASETLHVAAELGAMHKLRGHLVKAEHYYRLALEGFTKVLGPEDRATLQALHDLASVLRYKGNSPEAIVLYKQALEGREKIGGRENLETLETMDSLADLYQGLEQPVNAEPLRLFVLQTREKILGPKHADTVKTALNMGLLYSHMGKQKEALELFDRVFESRGTLLESQSPSACAALSEIAALYANIGHTNRSEMLYREVLSSQEDVLGPQHPDTLWSLNHLNVILFSKERTEAAISAVEKSATALESILGEHNLDTLWVFHNLAMIYAFLGRSKEAIQLQERVVEGYINELGQTHINTLYMVNDLGDCYLRAGEYQKAEETIRRAFEAKRKAFGPRSQYTLYTATLLACAIKELGRRDEAEKMFNETYQTTLETLGFTHSGLWWTVNYLAEFYIEARRLQEARDLYTQLLEVKTGFLGEEHASTLHTKGLLEATIKQMEGPDDAPLAEALQKPAQKLPSDFGYRSRNDIVQVLF